MSDNFKEIEKTQILDSMTDGAVFISPDLKIKYANKTFIEKYPDYKDNLEGQLCHKVIYNMDNPCITCSVKKVLMSKKPQRNIRSVKDGPSVLTIAYPVFDEKKRVTGTVITYRDVSESKQTEKALKREAAINKIIAELSQEILLPKISEENIAKKILHSALSLTKSSIGYVSSLNIKSNTITWKAFENYSLKTESSIEHPCSHKDKSRCISQFLKNKTEPFVSNHLQKFLIETDLDECNLTKESCLMVPALFNDELIGKIVLGCALGYLSCNPQAFLLETCLLNPLMH